MWQYVKCRNESVNIALYLFKHVTPFRNALNTEEQHPECAYHPMNWFPPALCLLRGKTFTAIGSVSPDIFMMFGR